MSGRFLRERMVVAVDRINLDAWYRWHVLVGCGPKMHSLLVAFSARQKFVGRPKVVDGMSV